MASKTTLHIRPSAAALLVVDVQEAVLADELPPRRHVGLSEPHERTLRGTLSTSG